MKNFSSVIGWILLTAVLAVPSVLFYNWWSANKAKEAHLAASQQGVPRDFFPGEENPAAADSPAAAQTLVTPDQPAAAQPEAAPVGAAPEAAGEKQPESQPLPSATENPPASPPDAQPAPEVSEAQPAGAPPAAAANESGEQGSDDVSYFTPRSKRNPFLTPDDYARMRAEEARRRQEAREQANVARKAPREVLVENRMNIQGIVGSNVIINGEMYSKGDTVLGARILGIGTNYIIGEHKGRRFRKYMQ